MAGGEPIRLELATLAGIPARSPLYENVWNATLCHQFSPGDKWLLFNALMGERSALFVTPFHNRPITRGEWIDDIAEADGTPFIAMEFVAGKTLDQTIGRKGLRVSEALRYSVQIADALEKAHAAGIAHRDLKPSNIMVTTDGLVKILDFGLAKLTEPARGDFGETRTVREAGPATEQGAIVGTVAYMSPEQAEGKDVDRRSDIFAFGAVLYEMVTGRRAFHGDSKLSTLSAILKEEPGALPPEIPRELEKVIVRCLRWPWGPGTPGPGIHARWTGRNGCPTLGISGYADAPMDNSLRAYCKRR